MSWRLRQWVARFTLAALLATFLSPSFGMAMHATHDELSDMAVGLAASGEGHDHERGMPGKHDPLDPHSFIGHLLSHMPFSVVAAFVLPPTQSIALPLSITAERAVSGTVKPPFRPPL
jgi:hypothetical protein